MNDHIDAGSTVTSLGDNNVSNACNECHVFSHNTVAFNENGHRSGHEQVRVADICCRENQGHISGKGDTDKDGITGLVKEHNSASPVFLYDITICNKPVGVALHGSVCNKFVLAKKNLGKDCYIEDYLQAIEGVSKTDYPNW